MVLKSALAAALCTGLLMSGSPALADEYRAGEFLGMDLSRALLSPKRLGRKLNSPRFRSKREPIANR